MNEMLTAVLGYPGVVASVMLGVVIAYWLFVMIGALDIDLLGGHGSAEGMAGGADGAADGVLHGADGAADGVLHGADGAADGVLHGAAKGIAEAAADGVLHGADGAADGALHGAAKGIAEAAADGALHGAHGADGAAEGATGAAEHGHSAIGSDARVAADLLSIANFRSVPVTVMLSVVVCFTWLLTVGGSRMISAAGLPLPWWLLGTLILVVSLVLALVPTAVTIKPLARFFVTHQAKAHAELVGKVCMVTTGRVDGKFGQASLETEGMSLLIQVRADDGTRLKKGDRALIVSWDRQSGAFQVEPYAQVVSDG